MHVAGERRPFAVGLLVLVVSGAVACGVGCDGSTSRGGTGGDESCLASSNFDQGLDGWVLEGDGALSWRENGGEAGGCLVASDPAEGPDTRALAPAEFRGDWSDLDGVGTISFSQTIFSGSNSEQVEVVISGPGGQAVFHAAPALGPFQGRWSDYVVPLRSSEWSMLSGTWSALLGDVRYLGIDMEFCAGVEVTGIDNVCLVRRETPAASAAVDGLP